MQVSFRCPQRERNVKLRIQEELIRQFTGYVKVSIVQITVNSSKAIQLSRFYSWQHCNSHF